MYNPTYFSWTETECKCNDFNCKLNIVEKLMMMLDKARGLADIPFVINSGARDMAHNRTIGGSATSSHILGKAVDIECRSSSDRMTMLSALLETGFNRIGVANNFIHVDIDEEKPQNLMWTY